MLQNKFWTSALLLIGLSHLTESAQLIFIKGSETKTVAFDNITDVVNTKFLDLTLVTFVHAFGYSGSANNEVISNVSSLNSELRNLVIVDYTQEANTYLDGSIPLALGFRGYLFNYPFAAELAKKVGEKLAVALLKLKGYGFQFTLCHLSGHSLGAQLMHYTAKKLKENGSLPQICWYMEAARLTFEGGYNEGVSKGDGVLVVGIMSDYGANGYGYQNDYADVNIRLNQPYYSAHNVQPGCPTGYSLPGSIQSMCSHVVGMVFTFDVLANAGTGVAALAANYDAFKSGQTTGTETIDFDIDTTVRGDAWICTNKAKPYGKGTDGTVFANCLT
ncbi:phospholipase A1-like [Anticarsia gemmatalis]|uniref:phospholipase A1-like n=1 Tax=Anticarsia gemmatalis TaxID=129554 RepID=UPI003F761201